MMTKTRWFFCPRPVTNPRLRLLCFPYAGGNMTLFRDWPVGLLPDIELWAGQLPGRGNRFREPLFTDMAALVEALAAELSLDSPYALLGCSFGATVAFELARELEKRTNSRPEHFFAIASIAPHLRPVHPPLHTLPDPQFVAELSQYNGIPQEILAHQELLTLLLPALRADLTIYERYQHCPGFRLSCPITAIGGSTDPLVSLESLEAWRPHTTKSFNHTLLPGDHFFMHTGREHLLTLINQASSE